MSACRRRRSPAATGTSGGQARGEASAREVGSRVSANLARDFELVLGEHRRSVHGGVDQQIGSQRLDELHGHLEDLVVVAPGGCVGQRLGADAHHDRRVAAGEHGIGERARQVHALGAEDEVELVVVGARRAPARGSSPASR